MVDGAHPTEAIKTMTSCFDIVSKKGIKYGAPSRRCKIRRFTQSAFRSVGCSSGCVAFPDTDYFWFFFLRFLFPPLLPLGYFNREPLFPDLRTRRPKSFLLAKGSDSGMDGIGMSSSSALLRVALLPRFGPLAGARCFGRWRVAIFGVCSKTLGF